MHPIDSLLNEFSTTRYAFNKQFNFNKNRINTIATRNTPVDSLQVEIIHSLALCFNLTMDEVYSKLKAYELTSNE